jgi:putative transcriptional regulator
MKRTKPGWLATALLETADDMRGVGVMDTPAHEKITLRHLGSKASAMPDPFAADEIRSLREGALV